MLKQEDHDGPVALTSRITVTFFIFVCI